MTLSPMSLVLKRVDWTVSFLNNKLSLNWILVYVEKYFCYLFNYIINIHILLLKFKIAVHFILLSVPHMFWDWLPPLFLSSAAACWVWKKLNEYMLLSSFSCRSTIPRFFFIWGWHCHQWVYRWKGLIGRFLFYKKVKLGTDVRWNGLYVILFSKKLNKSLNIIL